MTEREIMEYDVIIVGAGPAGLSCAIRLKQQKPELMVAVIEKSPEIGAGGNLLTELKNKMFKSTNHKYYIILLLILIVIGYIVIKKYKKVINTRKEKDVN